MLFLTCTQVAAGGFARLWDIFSLQLLRMKSALHRASWAAPWLAVTTMNQLAEVSEHDVYEVAYTSYHKDMCPRFASSSLELLFAVMK